MGQFSVESLLATRTGRRSLLIGTGTIAGSIMMHSWINRVAISAEAPFTLGIASGDPLPDSVVLWTRLATDPLKGGEMPQRRIPVQWQVATDEKMREVVKQGTAIAVPELAHSVHVEVNGLESARWYWYQFKVGSALSPVGRTRTAPAMGDQVKQLRFAFASCQHYEWGYYSAFQDMAQQDLDFVVHLGDYIYEGGVNTKRFRQHDGAEIITLDQYRNRYALYKSDLDLQAAHATFPWIVTWDDHEFDNNYANLVPEDKQTAEAFQKRRAAAYQAYYEHMPLRQSSLPKNGNLQLFRRFTFGDLAELNVLDTRQYRSDQPCGDGFKPPCDEALVERATLMGEEQERWLFEGLRQSKARWNILAQQVMMAKFDIDPRPAEVYNLDQWDGYVAARDRLFKFLNQQRPSNPVVITGDVHSSWVHDLKLDFNNPDSETIATEFVGTSISSDFGKEGIARVKAALPNNLHTQFFDGAFRGYVLCELTSQQWRTDFRAVADVMKLDSSISTLASFVVKDGQPGAKRV